MRPALGLVFLLLVTACGPVTVTVFEVRNGMVRFVVENRSEVDVQSISFEVLFRSPSGDPQTADTIVYTATRDEAGNPSAFVRAQDETFFNARLPSGSVYATARVLEVAFSDGSARPPR